MISSASHTGLSYKDRRSHQKKRFRFAGVILLVVAIFLLFSTFVLQSWVFETAAMEPGIPEGARVLVSPYLFAASENRLRRNPDRGDVVMVAPPYVERTHWRFRILDPVLRMVTFQKVGAKPTGLMDWENQWVFKRVVAVPGDTVRITDSVAHVRSADSSYFISEFEMSIRGYDINVPDLPDGWTDDMPLSGLMDETVLEEGEYFLLGDNRAASNDSRYWGPVDVADVRGQVLMVYWPFRNLADPADLSIYIHIPFCTSKCSYCDFYSVTGAGGELVRKYTEQLVASLSGGLDSLKPDSIDTVFIGGGTPSLLNPDIFSGFLEEVSGLTGDVKEFSIEVNPESLTADLLDVLDESNVNRISMGVQTYSEELLHWLERPAGRDAVERADSLLDSHWSGRLSRDILAALPRGSRRLADDLEMALASSPGHLSLYELAVEQGTKLAGDNILLNTLPDPDRSADEWEEAVDYLSGRGYARYEVSNFAVEGDECRHNMRYWDMRPYLGVGPSAASTFRGSGGKAVRRDEVRDLERWLNGVEPDEKTLSAGELLLEHCMMGLRTSRGLSLDVIDSIFGIDLIEMIRPATDKWESAGLLSAERGFLRTVNNGMDLLDSLLADIAAVVGTASPGTRYNWPALTVKYGAW